MFYADSTDKLHNEIASVEKIVKESVDEKKQCSC